MRAYLKYSTPHAASVDASKNNGRASLKHGGSQAAWRETALCEEREAYPGSLDAHAVPVHTSPDASHIAAPLSMYASLQDEGLASRAKILIDCVSKAEDVCCSGDIEVFKQLYHNIDSVLSENFSIYIV